MQSEEAGDSEQKTEITEAIKAYLVDPSFHAYVDRVEELWKALDAEFEAEDAPVHKSQQH